MLEKLMTVFVLGLAIAGCGIAPPEEEPSAVASTDAGPASNGAPSEAAVGTTTGSAQPELMKPPEPPPSCPLGYFLICRVVPLQICYCTKTINATGL